MKAKTMIQVCEMIVLAVAVSVALLILIQAVQGPHLWPTLATVSWNG